MQRENIEINDESSLEEWRLGDEVIYCYRDVWRDGRRIWHADAVDKPIEELEAARAEGPERLDGALLWSAELRDTISFRCCELTNANLWRATLTGADLGGADFTGADLYQADLQNTDVRNAKFTDPDDPQAQSANLEDAVFEGADLRGADFRRARLFQTVLTDTRINSRTKFDASTIPEVDAATIYEQ